MSAQAYNPTPLAQRMGMRPHVIADEAQETAALAYWARREFDLGKRPASYVEALESRARYLADSLIAIARAARCDELARLAFDHAARAADAPLTDNRRENYAHAAASLADEIITERLREAGAPVAPTLPEIGSTVTAHGNAFTVRRVEAVNAYGRTGWRVYFDLNGRRVYSPMALSQWQKLTR